jgi:hypothetical protein
VELLWHRLAGEALRAQAEDIVHLVAAIGATALPAAALVGEAAVLVRLAVGAEVANGLAGEAELDSIREARIAPLADLATRPTPRAVLIGVAAAPAEALPRPAVVPMAHAQIALAALAIEATVVAEAEAAIEAMAHAADPIAEALLAALLVGPAAVARRGVLPAEGPAAVLGAAALHARAIVAADGPLIEAILIAFAALATDTPEASTVGPTVTVGEALDAIRGLRIAGQPAEAVLLLSATGAATVILANLEAATVLPGALPVLDALDALALGGALQALLAVPAVSAALLAAADLTDIAPRALDVFEAFHAATVLLVALQPVGATGLVAAPLRADALAAFLAFGAIRDGAAARLAAVVGADLGGGAASVVAAAPDALALGIAEEARPAMLVAQAAGADASVGVAHPAFGAVSVVGATRHALPKGADGAAGAVRVAQAVDAEARRVVAHAAAVLEPAVLVAVAFAPRETRAADAGLLLLAVRVVGAGETHPHVGVAVAAVLAVAIVEALPAGSPLRVAVAPTAIFVVGALPCSAPVSLEVTPASPGAVTVVKAAHAEAPIYIAAPPVALPIPGAAIGDAGILAALTTGAVLVLQAFRAKAALLVAVAAIAFSFAATAWRGLAREAVPAYLVGRAVGIDEAVDALADRRADAPGAVAIADTPASATIDATRFGDIAARAGAAVGIGLAAAGIGEKQARGPLLVVAMLALEAVQADVPALRAVAIPAVGVVAALHAHPAAGFEREADAAVALGVLGATGGGDARAAFAHLARPALRIVRAARGWALALGPVNTADSRIDPVPGAAVDLRLVQAAAEPGGQEHQDRDPQ